MAGERTNRVPDSMSIEIPGFREAQSAWNEEWRRRDVRDRAVAADRAAWMRSRLLDQSAQARLMSDLNPLKVAGEVYAGEMLAAGLGSAGRAVLSTRMRPGYIRIPTGGDAFISHDPIAARRIAFVDTTGGSSVGRGGVSLNQTLADALQPTRMLIEDTVDRTVARTGNSLYFGMTGEETALLNPGKIVRHEPLPWNSATESRIRALAPKVGPAEATAYRVGYQGRAITDKVIRDFNASAPAPSVVESAWTAPQSVIDATTGMYKSAQETIRKIYADKEAVKALNAAFRTGNFDDPVMRMYRSAKEAYSASRARLERYAAAYQKGSAAAARSTARPQFQSTIEAQSRANSESIARRLSGKKTLAERVASVKPGSLWSDHVVPMYTKHWVAAPSVTAGAGIAGYVAYRRMSADKEADRKTMEVKAAVDPVRDAYLAITNDAATAAALSDERLLQKSLLDLRDVALAEAALDRGRARRARAAIGEYLARVENSQAMTDLLSRVEQEGLDPGIPPDVASRATNTKFYQGLED